MDEQEFNRQYDKARFDRAQHILDQITCQAYFDRLDATDLRLALVERMDGQMNIAETEIDCILGIIADRLGRLEELERSTMDWRYLVEGIVSVAYGLMAVYLCFTNIDVTPARLLVTYWPLYLIGAVAVGLVITVCERTRDE